MVIGVALAVLAGALVAVLVVRSQSSGSTSTKIDPVPTLAPVPPASADPQEAVEAAVIRDYLAAQAAYDEATGGADGHPPNADLPALKQHMTGAELTQVRVYIVGLKGQGLTGLGPPAEFHPRVASVKGNTAMVQDCYRSDAHIVDAKTHALRDTPGPVTRGWEATMELDQASGGWKMADLVTRPELCPGS